MLIWCNHLNVTCSIQTPILVLSVSPPCIGYCLMVPLKIFSNYENNRAKCEWRGGGGKSDNRPQSPNNWSEKNVLYSILCLKISVAFSKYKRTQGVFFKVLDNICDSAGSQPFYIIGAACKAINLLS